MQPPPLLRPPSDSSLPPLIEQQPLPSSEPDILLQQNASSSANVLILHVPFTAQAPLGNWLDPRQEDGCEEATSLMAVRWAEGLPFTLSDAEREIDSISDYELKYFGYFQQTSIRDTAERIIRGYFHYQNFDVRYGIGVSDIETEVKKGNAMIVAVGGRELKNPYFTPPGPVNHMIVILGYDDATKEFITNDPGTRHGEGFRYSEETLAGALRDYPSGNDHQAPNAVVGTMIVVHRAN